jgi:hypothetical protein
VSTTGTVNYHRHSSQRQAYRLDADGVSGRLASPEHVVTQIPLHDVRSPGRATSFEQDGIEFLPARSPLNLEDSGWEETYEAALQTLLSHALDLDEVLVFDHTLRVDDPSASRRPARNVHADYSPMGARSRLDSLLGPERACAWDAGHYAFINVWRPVCERVQSAPLGFVRPSSVRPQDWLTLDLIYPDRVGQIMGLVPNAEHEWLFRSEMTRHELVFFNIFDNQGRPPVAHSAVDLPSNGLKGCIRRSLESRTVVRFRT